ncbi:hypothetical protein SAMN04488096_10629 [Mesonia phycicola]|uniref:PH domain-containing protein n=1 Tax=Mesonia phycicola TaxID=579105 RepID=A0A1M6FAC5_9FLAO|nr:hypothetical protein [Mesonia phycicola]SHI94617.1 hypothetical protein SAMN04488096_10629 [Mesonia phycicola]
MKKSEKHIKTKIDYNVPMQIVILAILFLAVGIAVELFKKEEVVVWWYLASGVTLFLGLWSCKTYEIKEGYFKVNHFLGWVTTKRLLHNLESFQVKSVDLSSSTRNFFLLALYADRRKYTIFRKVELQFNDGKKMKIRENIIKGKTLNSLLAKIKIYQKRNKLKS